jgi:aminopeptidase N
MAEKVLVVSILFVSFLFSFLCLQVTAKEVRSSPKYTDWRLPEWILPRQYKLRLLPYLEDGNFTTDGQVEILLECMQETQLIVLHMAEITIVKDGLQVIYSYFCTHIFVLKLINSNNLYFFFRQLHDLIESRRVGVQSYTEDKTRQLLVIGIKNDTLRVGKFYRLSINFISQLNDKLHGFYRASYVEEGVKR